MAISFRKTEIKSAIKVICTTGRELQLARVVAVSMNYITLPLLLLVLYVFGRVRNTEDFDVILLPIEWNDGNATVNEINFKYLSIFFK